MRHVIAAFAVLTLAVCGLAQAQIEFVEVGVAQGIQPYVMQLGKTGGIAAADFDDDGDVDFFVPNELGSPDQLYRNLGNGQLEEIAASAGLASTDRSRHALWFDYDGDHLLDLFVASDCSDVEIPGCTPVLSLKLYRQVSDAQFEDVTAAAGFTSDLVTDTLAHRGGIAAGDINNDGFLDLVFGLWAGEARLFLNDTDGTFTEISASSGLGGIDSYFYQPMMYDFDGDGWLDIYYNIDFEENQLWMNQGNNTFINTAASVGAETACNEMGMALGDYDNDGDFDVYATNIYDPPIDCYNKLLRNDTVGSAVAFTEVADAAGVDNGWFGWGATFLDADNDTDLDLVTTNGFPNGIDRSVFFRNDGGDPVTFTDVLDIGFTDFEWGTALVAFDYDRDGDLDVVQACNGDGPGNDHLIRLLENRTMNLGNYLVIKPRMDGPNHRAIGSVVRIEIGSTSLMRLITAGTSMAGQEPAEAFFGLGSATVVDRVTVEWPDGTTAELTNVAANQQITIPAGLLFTDGFESGDTTAW